MYVYVCMYIYISVYVCMYIYIKGSMYVYIVDSIQGLHDLRKPIALATLGFTKFYNTIEKDVSRGKFIVSPMDCLPRMSAHGCQA